MINLKAEITRIIDSQIADKLNVVIGQEHDDVIGTIRDNFVQGNPRAFWEGFKRKPVIVDTGGDYPYLKLPSLVSSDEELFLIVDDSNEEYHILKGKIGGIMFFIEDCEGLDEYYLLSNDLKRIISENDHDQLLYLDLDDSI